MARNSRIRKLDHDIFTDGILLYITKSATYNFTKSSQIYWRKKAQTQKNTYCVIPFIQILKTVTIHLWC